MAWRGVVLVWYGNRSDSLLCFVGMFKMVMCLVVRCLLFVGGISNFTGERIKAQCSNVNESIDS